MVTTQTEMQTAGEEKEVCAQQPKASPVRLHAAGLTAAGYASYLTRQFLQGLYAAGCMAGSSFASCMTVGCVQVLTGLSMGMLKGSSRPPTIPRAALSSRGILSGCPSRMPMIACTSTSRLVQHTQTNAVCKVHCCWRAAAPVPLRCRLPSAGHQLNGATQRAACGSQCRRYGHKLHSAAWLVMAHKHDQSSIVTPCNMARWADCASLCGYRSAS